MAGLGWRLVIWVAAAAVVCVATPAASGRAFAARQVSPLGLVPLPRAAIGSAARSLPVDVGSGLVTDKRAAEDSDGFDTPLSVRRSGRVVGYFVAYGNDLKSSASVSQIESAVAEWRSVADARHAFRRNNQQFLGLVGLSHFGVETTIAKVGGTTVGDEHAAIVLTVRLSPGSVVRCAVERVGDGRYTMDAQACGSSLAAVQHLEPLLIRRLDQRLQHALAGKLRGEPVPSPRYPKPGPPVHGPQPGALVLRPSDMPAESRHGNYEKTGFRSHYELALSKAGPYADLYQDVYLSANSALAQYWAALFLWEDTHTGSYDYAAAPVHARAIVLHGVPDHPLAQIVRIPLANHRAGYHAHIILLHGPWLDYVTAERNAPIPSRDLTKLARLSANRLNSGLDR